MPRRAEPREWARILGVTAWFKRSVALVLTVLVGLRVANAEDNGELIGRRIERIEFHCAAPIDDENLRRIIPVHVGDVLGPDDIARMQMRLEQRDIFTAVVVSAEPREDGGVALIAQLVRKAIVNRVRFRGNHALRDSALERIIRLAPSSPYTDELRDFALQRIRDRYATEGFDAAAVSASVQSRGPGEVDVTFRIDEGEPLRIGSVEFEGDLPLPLDELRHAAGVKAGAPYTRNSRRNVEKAIVHTLRSKGYYEATVDGRWDLGADRVGTLRMRIEAGPLVMIEIHGAERLSERQIRKLIDLLNRPIVTDGTWRELARRTRRAYQELGCYFAQVDVHTEPGPPKIVHLGIDEGPLLHVATVEFEGNQGLSVAELTAALGTGPPSWIPWRRGVLLDDVLDDDLKRLWYLYRRRGYQSAEIVDLRTHFDREGGRIAITVVIEEGPRTTVTAVEHVGLAGIALPAGIVVRPGVPLNPDDVERDRRTLLSAQLQAGYPAAAVKADVLTAAHDDGVDATVRFAVTPGAAARVGSIIVQNNIDTRSRVVQRELTFKSGDPLNPESLVESQARLYRLGLFRTVDVHPLESTSNSVERDIAINVSERPPGSLQVGAGYNTRDGLRGFLEVSDNNLQGLARRLSLRGELSLDASSFTPDEYLGDLGYRDPRIFDTRLIFRSDVIAQRSTRSVDEFSVERVAWVPALEYPLSRQLRIGGELLIEDSRVFDVASDVLAFNPRDQGHLTTVGFGPFLVYDGRDDAFIPRRGIFDSLRMLYAPDALGSDVPFIRVQAQHSQYIPLTDVLTFVYVGRVGWALATKGEDQVPIRDRFFLGGRTTVRGFGENDIGPAGGRVYDANGSVASSGGDPIGGDLVVNVNAELRFPLAFGAGGAVFTDGGGLYLQDTSACRAAGAVGCDINFDNFRRSAGLGLRYDTPVGPISVDYGFKLDRRSDESVGEVHFSVGALW